VGGLPPDAVIAVPSEGLTLYRLVASTSPRRSDFKVMSPGRAEKRQVAELLRMGLSHYLKPQQADAVRTKPGSRIARVVLERNPRVYVARTGKNLPGHVEVWLPDDLVEALLRTAEIVG
jgi:hypothetical protein